MKESRTARIYLRIDAELKARMQEYAAQHHTSLSDIITRLMVRVLEAEEAKKRPKDAEQV